MANEIEFSFTTGVTCYYLIRNSVGQIYNGSTFETYATASYSTYNNTLTEQGTASGYYAGTFPTIAAGTYNIVGKQRITGSVAESDPTVATGTFQWGGTAVSNTSDAVTSGQLGTYLPLRISRGTMVQNFPVYFRSSLDHVTPLVSGIVSGQISRDGGAFGALQSGAFIETGLGFYRTSLTSGDLLANSVSLLFSAVGISGGSADPYPIAFILQRVSGQTIV